MRSRFVGGAIGSHSTSLRQIIIEDKRVDCLFDSGSPYSFVDFQFLQKHFPQFSKCFKRKSSQFFSVCGSRFNSIGICQMPVNYNDQRKVVSFYVIDTPLKLILGTDGLSSFKVSLNFTDSSSETYTEKSIESINSSYSDQCQFFSLFNFSDDIPLNVLNQLKELI